MRMIKRSLSALLVAALMISVFAVPALGEGAKYYGDVDADGSVTSADARLTLRAAVKLESLSEAQKKIADMNKDGNIEPTDARLILRTAVKLESLTPFAGDDKTWSSEDAAPAPDYEPAVFKSSAATLDLGYMDLGDFRLLMSSSDESEYDEDMDAYYRVYDISMGDVHQLDGVAEIRIPYSAEHVDAGQDPAKCVAAMYRDPDTGEWEPVLFDVDSETGEIIIYTDHFSTFGCFTFKNESKRMARAMSVSDIDLAGVAAAAAAMKEYTENGGEAGDLCRGLGRTYAEALLEQLKERANATADKMTNWSNIANLIVATVPGLDSGISQYDTTLRLWKDFGYAGIACAAVSLAIQMTNDEKTPADTANMYKDAMYLMISISQDSMLGTIGSAVWVVDRALTEMNTYGYNKVKDDLKMCYRWYMEKENRWHGKPRTLPQWRTIIRDISMKAKDDDSIDAAELIEREIDDYCNEFWVKGDSYIWEIYDELGQTGRGLPSEQMRREITDEFKGELLDRLTPVFNAVEKELKNQMRLEAQKRLNKIAGDYNRVTKIELVDDGKTPRYAGYTAVFEVADNGLTDAENWTVTLGDDGCATLKTTYLGYVLAGEPAKVSLYAPGKKAGKDAPAKTLEFVFSEPKTQIKLAPDDGQTGSYRGSYTETYHYDKDSTKSGERSYYVIEYNGGYYLTNMSQSRAEQTIAEKGVEAVYKQYFDNERMSMLSSSYDPGTKTSVYTTKSVITDIQYLVTTYTVTFDSDGGLKVKWETTNYFNDKPEKYESGVYEGKKI